MLERINKCATTLRHQREITLIKKGGKKNKSNYFAILRA